MARTYKQDCILAHALDLLGERWTFLIIRDLFLGPQRFGDLQSGLPGIGANLLSKRLKELEEAGLLESTDHASARSRYKLTERGEALRPAIRELMLWSIGFFMSSNVPSPAHDCLNSDDLRPDSVALAVELFANYHRDDTLNYVAHLHIDDFAYTLYYMNGSMMARRGADTPAIATIAGDVATFMQAFRKELSKDEAKARLKMSGNERTVAHLIECIVHSKNDQDEAPEKISA